VKANGIEFHGRWVPPPPSCFFRQPPPPCFCSTDFSFSDQISFNALQTHFFHSVEKFTIQFFQTIKTFSFEFKGTCSQKKYPEHALGLAKGQTTIQAQTLPCTRILSPARIRFTPENLIFVNVQL
jgi:hypothetical protein